MRDDYRSIEGVLFGLAGPPDARPASPSSGVGARPAPQPRSVPPEVHDRLDVTFGLRQLSDADRSTIELHYVRRVPQPGFARRRAIRALRATLAPVVDGS